ncbi:hypothetical protein D9M70_573460 [compost metagenome]
MVLYLSKFIREHQVNAQEVVVNGGIHRAVNQTTGNFHFLQGIQAGMYFPRVFPVFRDTGKHRGAPGVSPEQPVTLQGKVTAVFAGPGQS